ncbi:MAG: DNA translocase FtsK 4TM domain-containing protein, partial [Salinisphaera sp.]|uniref:DNA translocase FtsK 4TM domain-containing protein n=1 Tax=Salinisphaera sp. TaxID=1914330 RepID=UPI003C7D967F
MARAATRQGKTNASSSKAAKAGPKSSARSAANDAAATPSAYRQRLGRLLREAALFIAMAITLFLLAALISYNPADPGWSDNGNGTAVRNLLGVPGAWFADVLLSLFGYLGFIFPFLVLYGGWLIFVDRDRPSGELMSKSIRAGSLLLCLISACGLAWLMLGGIRATGLPQGSGGVVGLAAARPLAGMIKMIGAAWALITVFVITLSMGLGFSWLAVAERIGQFVLGGAVSMVMSVVDRFAAWRADRAERAAA